MFNKFSKLVCLLVVASLLSLNVATAQAGLISTEASIAASRAVENRALIKAQLEREDVRQVLAGQGLTAAEVDQRIDALSDAEVARIADHMGEMPAGGGAFGIIIGAALFVFIVLLITDMAGATDVFPFVKKAN
ncbi:MAG: PA2779 family protein [Pseudodesulfovibrio sp.]|uniref:PA2779 family protein n=1 Tax=Pseudodesulfovibrio indicus TaxID=1716143 RepID=A0A126QJ20_9BACT|nr:PA2779 family protein [Pseudodesulfovibrio indicus]AMK09970.1 hypothetical protein AWY79_01995 [Pseudodesulfovibrio indicus]TDT87344.1 hypothetical protein EDC59_1089 [Pseudodesulfovibrio indicus]